MYGEQLPDFRSHERSFQMMAQVAGRSGRKNKQGSAADMVRHFKDNTTPVGSRAKQENPELIERGIFIQKEMPEYCSEYEKLVQNAMKGS